MVQWTQEKLAAMELVQERLEDLGVNMGLDRFNGRVKKAREKGTETREGAVRKLLGKSLDPVVETFRLAVEGPKGRGRPQECLPWLEQAGHEVAALISLQEVFDGLTQSPPRPIRKVALTVSRRLIRELKYARLAERAPHLFEYKLKVSGATGNKAHLARSMGAALKSAICKDCWGAGVRLERGLHCEHMDMGDLELAPESALRIGFQLVDLVVKGTSQVLGEPAFAVSNRVSRRRRDRGSYSTEQVLLPSAACMEWLMRNHAAVASSQPVNLPMAVPPIRWTAEGEGGYRFAQRGEHPAVRGVSKAQRRRIHDEAGEVVWEALSRISETPWEVNRRVYEEALYIGQQGGGVAGLPQVAYFNGRLRPYQRELPYWPDRSEDPEEKRRRADATRKVIEHNLKLAGDAQKLIKPLWVAETLEKHGVEVFWFPHNMDWRGRVYPIPNYLNPQGHDLAKGLLRFATGKELGAGGWRHLARHGANALGKSPAAKAMGLPGEDVGGLKLDKLSFAERVQWIERHSDAIRLVAADPRHWTWWHDADKPFQFLAFCFEWAAWVDSGRSPEYVSKLVVAVDGSCNGIQHMSALSRDAEGGREVNLLPGSQPRDVYQKVADAVAGIVANDAADGDALGELWLGSGLIDRKLAKRPSMTFGYGSGVYGFGSQILLELRDRDNWPELRDYFGLEHQPGDDTPTLRYIADRFNRALEQVVPRAFAVREWLQRSVREVAKVDRHFEWRVPGTGLPVAQVYYDAGKVAQIRTKLGETVVKPGVYKATKKANVGKSVNGIAPNVIHSLDAAALMMTVARASHAGVDHFAMVHDSFGTHAADMDVMEVVLREAFVALYTEYDVVGYLQGEFQRQAGDPVKLPEAPVLGDLDVSNVLVSQYFFG